MAVGDGAKVGIPSYVAFSKETTFGTYASATSAMEPISVGIRTDIRSEKVNQIGLNRGFSKRVQLEKNVAGPIEAYLHPVESVLPMIVAMGGTVTSAGTSTTGYTHSISAGNLDQDINSMSFNIRKGDTHTWRYTGGRVNNMRISANTNELVRVAFDMVFKDSTQTADDISSSLSVSSVVPLTFVEGVYRYAATEADAGTSTSEEPIQGFELNLNNNLATGPEAREFGDRTLSVLPPTRREVTLTIRQRWDTTTTWDRFIDNTQGAVALKFTSQDEITTGSAYTMEIMMPKVFLNSPEPTIDSPEAILTSELVYDVLVDNPATTTGKDIGITVFNDVASY